jgi:putative hydrolase of the HAD superfamily
MKTGANASMASSEEGAKATATIFPLFDHIIQSAEAGVRKPDPRIYLMMCDALDVKPEACVYLDDLGVNCKPAATLGMTAIKVVSEQQLLDDLEEAVGLTFART